MECATTGSYHQTVDSMGETITYLSVHAAQLSNLSRANPGSTADAFSDASGYGVSPAMFTQDSGVMQGLVTAESCLTKQGLTIPCLELVSGHRTANLAVNVCTALERFPLATNIQCWLDSTMAFHYLSDNGKYRQFVANLSGK